MILELAKSDFGSVQSLVNPRCNAEARSVIDGYNPGWVFADDNSCPTTALVWSRGVNGFILLGDRSNQGFLANLDAYVTDELIPRAKRLGYEWFEISGAGEEWDPVIEAVFGRRDLSHWTQTVYAFRDTVGVIPGPGDLGEFRLLPVDKNLLKSPGSLDISLVTRTLSHYWDSHEAFLENGFGYLVANASTGLSLCYTSFVTEDIYELGIETLEPFRRRGFGKSAAAACLREAVQKGRLPYWDCSKSNIASASTAEAVGFTKAWEYECYGFRI